MRRRRAGACGSGASTAWAVYWTQKQSVGPSKRSVQSQASRRRALAWAIGRATERSTHRGRCTCAAACCECPVPRKLASTCPRSRRLPPCGRRLPRVGALSDARRAAPKVRGDRAVVVAASDPRPVTDPGGLGPLLRCQAPSSFRTAGHRAGFSLRVTKQEHGLLPASSCRRPVAAAEPPWLERRSVSERQSSAGPRTSWAPSD